MVGDPAYYGRFGYALAANWGVELPFEGVEAYSLAVELEKEALSHCSGRGACPAAFGES